MLVHGAVKEMGRNRMLQTIVLVCAGSIDLIDLGALPAWPYSSGWGYYPSGGLGVLLIIVLILLLL